MKYILYGIASLVLFALALVTSFFLKPSIYINNSTLSYAQKKFLPEYSIPWQRLDINIQTKNLGSYVVNLSASEACVEKEKSKSKYCIESMDASFRVNLLDGQIFEILNLQASSDLIQHELAQSKSTESNYNIYSLDQSFQAALRSIQDYKIRNIDLDLSNIKIIKPDLNEALVKLKLSTEKGQIQLSLIDKSLDAAIELNRNSKDVWSGSAYYKAASINYKVDIDLQISDQIQMSAKNNLVLQTDQNIVSKNLKFTIDYIAKQEQSTLRMNEFELAMTGSKGSIRPSCEMDITDSETHDLNCKAQIITKIPKQNEPPYFTITADLTATIQNEILINDQLNEVFSAEIKLDNDKNNFFDISGGAKLSFLISNNKSKLPLKDVGLIADINNYNSLVLFLNQFNILIPAPFHSLEGNLQLKVTDFKSINDQGYEIPVQVQANLDKSKYNQALFSAEVIYKTQPNDVAILNADVNIDKLYLYLPNIDPIRGIPTLKSDPRIQKEIKKVEKESAPLKYSINLSTSSNQSIRVYYKYIKPYLSFGLNVSLSEKLAYEINKGNEASKIEYLKRELSIQKLSLGKQKNGETTDLDIQLKYIISGYNIFINIGGLVDNPILILNSEPQLPRDDIISLVLYGKRSSDLASFQKESVGSTQAAINDRALGLFSIWAFASTPIDSVSYDSSRNVYSASVSLPGQVSLDIGTNWEEVNSVSLRKYIANGWSFVTSYEPSDFSEDKSNFLLKKEISY